MPRITLRLDDDLYNRLRLFAQGRSRGRSPELSPIVREALEQYLVPRRRQTGRQTDDILSLRKEDL
jgi:predicted transcriptional regulator